jgi:hypothetical protein
MAQFTIANKNLTEINRGGLKFVAIKGVFDSNVYIDNGIQYTDSKNANPIDRARLESAQEDFLECAKGFDGYKLVKPVVVETPKPIDLEK